MSHPGSTAAVAGDLAAAVIAGDFPRVEVLLAEGDFSGARIGTLEAALKIAVRRQQFLIAEVLLDVRQQTATPFSARLLIAVAQYGTLGFAKRVFDLVADVRDIAMDSGRTPLQAAAFTGNAEVIALLLCRGADVNPARVWDRHTPLQQAARNGHLVSTRLLLDAGADIEVGDRDGMTALSWADLEGYENVAALLIENGADPRAREVHRRTAIHRAAATGTVALVRQALSAGAEVNAPDLWGDRPLHLAVRRNRLAIVTTLLDAGADVNAQNALGETPLVLAATDQMGQHPQTVRLLLEHKTDPNLATLAGWSALHALVYMNAPELLSIAVVQGGLVEQRDSKGETPFLTAVGYCHPTCMKVLLEAGADPLARNSEGHGAADVLVHWGAMTGQDHQLAESARVLKWALVDVA